MLILQILGDKVSREAALHCHYDSEDEEAKDTPCCHQAQNLAEADVADEDLEDIKCVPCR